MLHLNVSHRFLPKQNSTRASLVMDHFGIDFEQGEHVIARDLQLPLKSGQVALFTGESGSGKSSLMRQAAAELRDRGDRVIDLDELTWDDRILVDLLPLPLEASLQLLSACGLGEAHLMLRTPAELSDGQRYRFRLALALSQRPDWIIADEFTATLDRRLAKMIAFNLQKTASRSGTGFLLATTHDDVVTDLSPQLHVRCRLDGHIEVVTAEADEVRSKKKCPTSEETCGFPPRPSPTGRISLGGIIAAITSG
ncbi:ATP-binding cassette domain-containing protein [Planctomicrobium sp. SH661]|uniref:ATP-binding cassette domain-containing protein n=1 Tax=Planctomicrobium sp. SH661 TaxID=3448124 RepID=UPI003F5AF8F9